MSNCIHQAIIQFCKPPCMSPCCCLLPVSSPHLAHLPLPASACSNFIVQQVLLLMLPGQPNMDSSAEVSTNSIRGPSWYCTPPALLLPSSPGWQAGLEARRVSPPLLLLLAITAAGAYCCAAALGGGGGGCGGCTSGSATSLFSASASAASDIAATTGASLPLPWPRRPEPCCSCCCCL
jgi:hypothetical protein